MAAGRQTRHHRWQIRQPAVLSKLRSSALWPLRLLSATTAKSISEVKPSNQRGAHNRQRRCTERTIQGPTPHRTGYITGKWRASVPGNRNPGTDAGIWSRRKLSRASQPCKRLNEAGRTFRVQICQFHQMQIVRRHITQDPDIEASAKLLELVKNIRKMDKESFIGVFEEWYEMYKDVADERVQDKRIKRPY